MPGEDAALYLTFDDGPVDGPTDFVLDCLRTHHIKATFFCIGDNIRKHPHVYSQIVTEGHAVGNHTFNHLNGWSTALEHYVDNVALCETQLGSKSQRLFRPPYGRITRGQIRRLSDFRIIMWDVLTLDYDKSRAPERSLRNVLAACRPGSILVFHDSLKAEKNLRYMLPRLLDHFGGKQFQFKAIEIP